MYQELVFEMSVALAMSSWYLTHSSCVCLDRLDLSQAASPQVGDAAGNPVDLVLQAGGHVA
jgi:hypothetical protein